MTGNRRRRGQLFVNREIQGRLLNRLAIYWMGYHLFLWHALFLAQWIPQQVNAIAAGRSVSVLDSYREFLVSDYLLPLIAVAIFPLVFWDMLKLSHRFSGPLVQVRNRLLDMANGCPPQPVHFRSNDLLSEIQEAFNTYIESLTTDKPDVPEASEQSEEQYSYLVEQIRTLQEAVREQNAESPPDSQSPTPAPVTSGNDSDV